MFPDVPVQWWEILILSVVIGPWFILFAANAWTMRSKEYKNRKIF